MWYAICICKEVKRMSEIRVDQRIYREAPLDLAERSEEERETFLFLDRLGIPYDRVEHEPAMTIEACEEIDRLLGVSMCKNLFLCNRQQTAFYLLMMPGNKPFRTKDLSAQIQSARLSFADETFMWDYLHIRPGSVSVMGLLFDTQNRVRLLIDEDLLAEPYIGCHPCVNTGSLKIRTGDLLQKILPETGHAFTAVSLPDAGS